MSVSLSLSRQHKRKAGSTPHDTLVIVSILICDVCAKLKLEPNDFAFAIANTYTTDEFVEASKRERTVTASHDCGGWHYSTNSDYANWEKSEHVTEGSRRRCNHFTRCNCLPTKVDESEDIDLYCPHFMGELKLKNPR